MRTGEIFMVTFTTILLIATLVVVYMSKKTKTDH